jgi:hypothetical protein
MPPSAATPLAYRLAAVRKDASKIKVRRRHVPLELHIA